MSNYHVNSNLAVRFYDHLVLGLRKDIPDTVRGNTGKNLLERAGDAGLWLVEELPKKIWEGLKNPKVITVALTAIALIGLTFAFYPSFSILATKVAFSLLPQIPLWAIKFAAYIILVETTLAAAFRAQGRFYNAQLMTNFYAN